MNRELIRELIRSTFMYIRVTLSRMDNHLSIGISNEENSFLEGLATAIGTTKGQLVRGLVVKLRSNVERDAVGAISNCRRAVAAAGNEHDAGEARWRTAVA